MLEFYILVHCNLDSFSVFSRKLTMFLHLGILVICMFMCLSLNWLMNSA
jgi:hypothetical protein